MQITFDGRTQNASAWAREIGISRHLLRWRLQCWSLERALTTPKQPHGKLITHDGRTQYMAAWARDLGITSRGLRERLRRGEPLEMALRRRR
jgi:hypothetical protein